jgi:hypothetical protein
MDMLNVTKFLAYCLKNLIYLPLSNLTLYLMVRNIFIAPDIILGFVIIHPA